MIYVPQKGFLIDRLGFQRAFTADYQQGTSQTLVSPMPPNTGHVGPWDVATPEGSSQNIVVLGGASPVHGFMFSFSAPIHFSTQHRRTKG